MTSALGFYGIAVEGLPESYRWLRPQDDSCDVVTVRRSVHPFGSMSSAYVNGESARFELPGRGSVWTSKCSDSICAEFLSESEDAELLHPLVTSAVAVRRLWSGIDVLHGGVVGRRDGALCVLGGREFGKSSTLFVLHERSDLSVFSDDLCVTDGSSVWAGPGCLDLRDIPRDAVKRADVLGEIVRAGSRFRITLPCVQSRVPLVGLVLLQWGAESRSYLLGADKAVEMVVASRMHKHVNMDPVRLLGLAELPMLCIERPRNLSYLSSTALRVERWLEGLLSERP